MSALDIVIAIPLLWAIYKGFTEGIMLQLGGIAGLLIGVWLAFRYSTLAGSWLGFDSNISGVVGFIIIVVIVIIAITLVGRLVRGLFKFAGLGMFDTIGGVLLSVIKMALIISVLLTGFAALNSSKQLVKRSTLSKSVLYEPILGLSSYVFPYIDFVKGKLLELTPKDNDNEQEE